MQRRKFNLKTKLETGSSYFSLKRLVPGTFNMNLIGSTCTALPRHGDGEAGELGAPQRRHRPGAYTRSLSSST